MCTVSLVITAWYSHTCKLGATLTPVSKFSSLRAVGTTITKVVKKVSFPIRAVWNS